MKSCSQALLNLIPQPKTVNARLTFRVERPRFATTSTANTLNITDPTQIDSCAYGTGIVRVTNYNGALYFQIVPNVYSAWPAWVNTGIALFANSRPGVDGGYIWYQKSDQKIYWRDLNNWNVETLASSTILNPQRLAPIGNQRCYKMTVSSVYTVLRWNDANDVYSGAWTGGPNKPGCTFDSMDAVSVSGVDYVYFSDRALVTSWSFPFTHRTRQVFSSTRPGRSFH